MSAKLKAIKATLAAKQVDIEIAPRCRADVIAARNLWLANQKAYRKVRYDGHPGRFPDPVSLIDYVSEEIAAGRRTRAAIARDAGIAPNTLRYIVEAGKLARSDD